MKVTVHFFIKLRRISEMDKIPENVMKSLSLDHPSTEKRIRLIENSKS
jgi:STE24 endopeptidase